MTENLEECFSIVRGEANPNLDYYVEVKRAYVNGQPEKQFLIIPYRDQEE